MQTVANLDKYDANIIAHGEEQFLEVFRLGRCSITKNATANLRESIHNLGDFVTKDIFDVFYRIVCVFHHIVQKGRTDTGRP